MKKQSKYVAWPMSWNPKLLTGVIVYSSKEFTNDKDIEELIKEIKEAQKQLKKVKQERKK
jgi:cysteine sulfinate desulfinase/cysteine desulfurase-like protein